MARMRNYNKMRILGIIANLKTIRNSHTNAYDRVHDTVEKTNIDLAIIDLTKMIDNWDKNTRTKIDKIIVQK